MMTTGETCISMYSNPASHDEQRTLKTELDDLRQLKIAKNNIYRSNKSAKAISMVEWEKQQRALKEADRESKCMAIKQLHHYRPKVWKNRKKPLDDSIQMIAEKYNNEEILNDNSYITFVQKALDADRSEEKIEEEHAQCDPCIIDDDGTIQDFQNRSFKNNNCLRVKPLEDFQIRNEEKLEEEFQNNTAYVIHDGRLVLEEPRREFSKNVEEGVIHYTDNRKRENQKRTQIADVKIVVSRKSRKNYSKEIVEFVRPQIELRQQYVCGCAIS
mmetsp:Transcript_24550/g.36398  ORF Transcript_24550/g.36398 Transcript_24550/m.36398 type:complete len:272 (-) Transcript_24550:128-943(-)